jgi:hypothetical protein
MALFTGRLDGVDDDFCDGVITDVRQSFADEDLYADRVWREEDEQGNLSLVWEDVSYEVLEAVTLALYSNIGELRS